jgi:hypothetical protein
VAASIQAAEGYAAISSREGRVTGAKLVGPAVLMISGEALNCASESGKVVKTSIDSGRSRDSFVLSMDFNSKVIRVRIDGGNGETTFGFLHSPIASLPCPGDRGQKTLN